MCINICSELSLITMQRYFHVMKYNTGDYEKTHFCNFFFASSTQHGSRLKIYIFHWWRLGGYVSAQNNRHWGSNNVRETLDVSLHDHMTGMWCDITATQTAVPIFSIFNTLLFTSRREKLWASAVVMTFKQFIYYQKCTYMFITAYFLQLYHYWYTNRTHIFENIV
jgi:hypothetical protein